MRRLLPVVLTCLVLGGCASEPRAADPAPEGSDTGALSAEEVEPSRSPAPSEPSTGAPDARSGAAPAVARTPRQLARQLETAEATLRDPEATPAQRATAGHTQQAAYLELGPRRGWDARVKAALPRSLHRDLEDNVASRREFLRLHGGVAHRTLPAWRIIEPAPAAELRRHYQRAERRFGVDWEYLAAINLVETGMGRIEGYSVAGARGPMQFMPATWAQYGRGDIDSPRDSIMSAGRYLDAMGFARDRDRALYRYNNSGAYVRGVTLLAEVMQRRPHAFEGYYHWQVYYQTARGHVRLPQGYSARREVRLRDWLATSEGRSGRPLRAAPR